MNLKLLFIHLMLFKIEHKDIKILVVIMKMLILAKSNTRYL